MKTFFKKNNSNNLIIFFCGWGLDEKPFEYLEEEDSDVLFVYDYSNLDFQPNIDFSSYKKKSLIAFSYGVFMASLVSDSLPDFEKKIAVNGTLKPIDKDFGINPKIFALTLGSISEETMGKFYCKMFDNNLDWEYFNEHYPERPSKECKFELEQIQKYYQNSVPTTFRYDMAIISNSDKIIPTKNQMNFWQNSDSKEIEGGHFSLYKFKNFGEIISL